MVNTWFLYGLVRNVPLLVDPPEDDEDLKKEAYNELLVSTLLGPANAMPLIGDIVERLWWNAAAQLTGQEPPFWVRAGADNPIFDLYADPERALASWMRLAKAENSDTYVDDDELIKKKEKAIGKSIRAVSRWGGISNALLNMPGNVVASLEKGDYTAAAMAVLGSSPFKIKQRLESKESDTFDLLGDDEPKGLIDWAGFNDSIEQQLNDEFPDDVNEEDTSLIFPDLENEGTIESEF